MSTNDAIDRYRRHISGLVAEAIREADDDRRTALLVMADHWAAMLRSRLGRFTDDEVAMS